MPDQNVEIVHRAYELLNAGEIDAFIGLCSDDFVMDMSERIFNPDTYRGPDGIRRFHRDVREAWKSYQWDVEDARENGDSVVALLHCHGLSRSDAPPVDWRVAWVWRFDGEKPVSLRFYRDRADALAAAGLPD